MYCKNYWRRFFTLSSFMYRIVRVNVLHIFFRSWWSPCNSLHLRRVTFGYASVRTFWNFDHFHIFDLFCPSTHWLYFDQNFTSSRPIRSPDLTKCRSKEVEVERSKYRKGRTDAYPYFVNQFILYFIYLISIRFALL